MYLLRYAARNLLRHRGRTVLTMTAVALAVGLVMVGQCLMAGVGEGVMGEFTSRTGHVRIRHADYEKESRFDPLDYNLKGVKALRDTLSRLPGVTAIHPRISFRAMIQYTDESTIVPESVVADEDELTDEEIFGAKKMEFAQGVAIAPSLERQHNKLHKQLLQGSEWFSGNKAREILIGVELARRLGVKAGAQVELVSYREGLTDISVTVAGIFDTGNTAANRQCFVPLAVAEDLLRLDDEATELLVFTDSYMNSSELLTTLTSSPATTTLELTDWKRIGLVRMIVQLIGAFLSGLLFIIVVVASVGLLNTMLMTVMERQKEIGVLLALGLSRWRVVSVLMMEAVVFGVLGSLIGAIFGSAACFYLAEHGIELGAENTRKLIFPIEHTMKGVFTLDTVIIAITIGCVVAVLGAFWPALKASAFKPVEAMRKH